MPEAVNWAALPAIGTSSAVGYLLGSIPFAAWIAGRSGVDPLAAGERNSGATNVWRLLGPRSGTAVLALDIGKGAAAALFGLAAGGWWASCAGLVLAMVGHAWPPWSRFRGGRSVACLVGGGLVLAPLPFAIALVAFGLLVWPAGLWRAAAVGLLAYPVLFVLLVADRRLLIGLGFAYLVLLIAWTANGRRRAAGFRASGRGSVPAGLSAAARRPWRGSRAGGGHETCLTLVVASYWWVVVATGSAAVSTSLKALYV